MSTNKKSYIGLTIGPIFPTLQKIRSTRALFSTSYLFSYLMREIISGLVKKGIKKDDILTPSTLPTSDHPEAGYYADRLILDGHPGYFDSLLEVKETLLMQVAKAIAEDLGKQDIKSVHAYLEDYMMLYAIEYDVDPEDDPFGKLNKILNGLEQQRYFPVQDSNVLVDFLNLKRQTFLMKDAFKNKKSFPSIIDISTADLKQYDPTHYEKTIKEGEQQNKNNGNSDVKSDANIILQLAKSNAIKKHIKNYHKYIAVVHADGDKIGDYIKSLGNDNNGFRAFSDQLLTFSQEAKKMIDGFGGRPIYIGGDDMLFLAPIATQDGETFKTVFDLVNDIDKTFTRSFAEKEKACTFSYGISMTYFKHPLNEARNLSHDMEGKAKRDLGGKNRIVTHLQKGSGASFELDFQKSNADYKTFVQLVNNQVGDKRFFSSLIHRLGFHKETITHLCGLNNAEKRLQYFFDNNFDEEDHKRNKEYFKSLNDFIRALYQVDHASYFNTLVNTLRFIHFLRSSDYEE